MLATLLLAGIVAAQGSAGLFVRSRRRADGGTFRPRTRLLVFAMAGTVVLAAVGG